MFGANRSADPHGANLSDLVKVDDGLYGFPLRVVVAERVPPRTTVVSAEPVVQQKSRGLGAALVLALAPVLDSLANSRNAGSRRYPSFEQTLLIGCRCALTRHLPECRA